MTERKIEEAEVALALELWAFLQQAVAQVLQQEDESEFLAWVRAEAPRRIPGLFADLPNEQAARSIAFEMAREIWNKVPLPGAGTSGASARRLMERPSFVPQPRGHWSLFAQRATAKDPTRDRDCSTGRRRDPCCCRW